jgi:NAD-dependent deacetylase
VQAVAVDSDVAGWLHAASQVSALTGAGISTESGIPDFRGPQGVWTRNPAAQALFTLDNYLADPDLRATAWRNRLAHPAWEAQPNAGHRALVTLEQSGRLRAIVTQNIDGLHQRAGNDPQRVIEIHGTLFEVECLTCGLATGMRENLDRVEAGEPDPACLVCGGIQKAATISFGQQLKVDVFRAAQRAVAQCDVLLAVGTTLQVQPAAGLAGVAVAAGARLVIVNSDATPYDDLASALLRDPIGETLQRLVAPLAA